MINIENVEKLDEKYYKLIDEEFNLYAKENEVACDYVPFNFVAKEDDKVVGILTGHSYYKEVHVGDLIVLKDYRKRHIGTKLLQTVEEYYKNKGFENMNLTTYGFQAPEFYKKCGFKLEFVRKNKDDPKLNKYFFVKNI